MVKSASFSPDGDRIVTTSIDRTARLWDLKGHERATLRGHADFVYSATFSPDGTRVITFGQDHTARMWDSRTGEPLAEFGGHSKLINSVAFFPDGARSVTVSDDGTLKIFPASIDQFFDIACGMLLHRKVEFTRQNMVRALNGAKFSADGTSVSSVGVPMGTRACWTPHLVRNESHLSSPAPFPLIWPDVGKPRFHK